MDNKKEINQTSLPQEFILMGLTNHVVTKTVLFAIFLLIYSAAIIGNLLILALVKANAHLHTPMYFFLSNFSILELCYTSTVVPQMLFHLLSKKRVISLIRCVMQLYLFLSFGITECFLLTVMSYDRYVAICLPLHYTLLMTKQACIFLATASWAGGLFLSAVNTALMLKLSFHGHKKIDHFLCEMPAMVRIAYGEIHKMKMSMSITCVFTLILPLLVILVSYFQILHTVLGKHGNTGKHKAISTCSSHLAVVILFFGSVISIYLGSISSTSQQHTKLVSVFYIVVTPALNPLIYSLRNKEVMQALKKVMNKDIDMN